jgi:hypothetical protein
MASSKPIILSDHLQVAASAKVLEEAYLHWVEHFSAQRGCRLGYRFVVEHYRPRSFWKKIERGAFSSVTLFPSTPIDNICRFWEGPHTISIADAIGGDWFAVGKDLYSAFVKDRIKTHNCGQYSFSFEPESESESESTVTASR